MGVHFRPDRDRHILEALKSSRNQYERLTEESADIWDRAAATHSTTVGLLLEVRHLRAERDEDRAQRLARRFPAEG